MGMYSHYRILDINPSSFSPASVTGMAAWYRASSEIGFTAGQNLIGQTITDFSSNLHGLGTHGNGTWLYQTGVVNGLASFYNPGNIVGWMEAQGDTPQSAYAPTGQLSIFVAFKPTDTGNIQGIVASVKTGNPDGGFAIYKDSNTAPNSIIVQTGIGGTWASGAGITIGTVLNNTFNLAELIIDATSTQGWLNGTASVKDTSHGAIATGRNLFFGAYDPRDAGGITFPFFGYIPEVIVYSYPVSTTNQSNIRNYMRSEYGI